MRKASQSLVVIGLDGTPYSFLKKEIEAGNLPNIADLTSGGHLGRIDSEIPTISSVAWASFMTGVNPGTHGIYGFTDRKPGTYELYFPNYNDIKVKPFWDTLSSEGRRCCVINVPSTYPARALNGILVSGFVAPNLERASYPREAYEYLNSIDYRVDVDASKARESLDLLLEDLHLTLDKRRQAMLHFWENEDWDFFMCVFTGTDRLHHFMWKHYEESAFAYASEFMRYYKRIDELVGEFVNLLPDSTSLFMLSDHGFCLIKSEVYLNNFLREIGLLSFKSDNPRSIADIDPSKTKVYCMDPGRLYVNLKGREPGGIVDQSDYKKVIEEVTEAISQLKDPQSGQSIVDHIYTRVDLYEGPCADKSPDLVVSAVNGYDLKGFMDRNSSFGTTHLTGMHTFNDAFLLQSKCDINTEIKSIRQVAGSIKNIFNVNS